MSRRRWLGLAGGAALGLAVVPTASLARPAPVDRERRLSFYNLHTGERLSTTYWSDGDYDGGELGQINWLLRDFRNDEQIEIDVRLLDILHSLHGTLETARPFHIISGYRSPATNQMLARNGHGVAKHSLHLSGRAIDIRIPGTPLKSVRQVALRMAAGGVGYYPNSNFVHLDTGRVRRW